MSTVTKDASSRSDDDVKLRRGPWTVEEDRILIDYITSHGEGRWNLLAKRSGLRRTGKSCRLRWLNYLKPDVKRGNLTPQEQLLILELHSNMGNRWSKIAQHLPGRTDNEIKNYWRTRVEKQARNLKIDSKSTAFGEVIRCLWMPRLLQKIHGSSHSLDLSSQYSAKTQPPNVESLSPTQVHTQVPLHTSSLACSLDDHQKNCSSLSIDSCSDDQSMHISPVPQISEYPTSPFQAVGNNDHYSTFFEGCYNVDNIRFDMESYSLTATSALGDFRDPITDLHIVENNWMDDNRADSLWNMDELWKFRQL